MAPLPPIRLTDALCGALLAVFVFVCVVLPGVS